jgi:hypothetical protein
LNNLHARFQNGMFPHEVESKKVTKPADRRVSRSWGVL